MLNAIQSIHEEIRQTYLEYPYPWVIGYSGGKDSTTTLQLVWNALREIPEAQRIELKKTKPIYVISTDTLVETPIIVDHTDNNIQLINQEAARQNMPIEAHKLSPVLNDKFWVNMIGRGYPAPNSIFRWCTERLKINPSNKFILERVSEYGQVILVLGSRRGESATRDQVFNRHHITGHKLARHGQLSGAWVYTPIEHFTTNDVWTYLIQSKSSPWGSDNRQLSSMYQSAQDGECPLVVDSTTPSCGNSRFGCWVCTVVTRDKSMEAMIDSGEEWMIPLLDYRDWLSSTQDPAVKPAQREFKGRDGRIKITVDGRLRYRTYTLDFSKQMLRRLLNAQIEIQEDEPDFVIIDQDELREIHRLWLTGRQDWQDSLPAIYKEATGQRLDWEQNDAYTPGQLELNILQKTCAEHGVPLKLVQKLLDVEWQQLGMGRRATIHKRIKAIYREDWRNWNDVEQEMTRRQQENQEVSA